MASGCPVRVSRVVIRSPPDQIDVEIGGQTASDRGAGVAGGTGARLLARARDHAAPSRKANTRTAPIAVASVGDPPISVGKFDTVSHRHSSSPASPSPG